MLTSKALFAFTCRDLLSPCEPLPREPATPNSHKQVQLAQKYKNRSVILWEQQIPHLLVPVTSNGESSQNQCLNSSSSDHPSPNALRHFQKKTLFRIHRTQLYLAVIFRSYNDNFTIAYSPNSLDKYANDNVSLGWKETYNDPELEEPTHDHPYRKPYQVVCPDVNVSHRRLPSWSDRHTYRAKGYKSWIVYICEC